jgi:putative ABC transport system permease protein
MYIFKLAIRNFFRNTRRSIISGLSVAIAIMAIIFAQSYIQGIIQNVNDNIVRLVSGHINITTLEYKRRERLLPLDESIELDEQIDDALDNEEITQISPRIKFGVLLGEEELSIPALGYAFTPEIEQKISGLDKRIIKGGYIASGEKAALLGVDLAKRLDLDINDTLTIITRTAYDSPTGINLIVKGLFETGIGGVDRSLFYIPLDIGQQLLDMDAHATEIVVQVRHPDRAISIAQEIQSATGLSAVPFQHNKLLRYVNIANLIYGVFYFIILLVACSTIANTMLMVVFERTREIGMMKAMGLNTGSVVALLTIEAGLIGVMGSLCGSIFGSGLSYWFKYHGIDISFASSTSSQSMPFGPVIYLSPTPLIIFGIFVFGLIATIIVALLPISKVTKMKPARALKTV